MPSEDAIRLWTDEPLALPILSANATNDTITIDGDYTAIFKAGSLIRIGGAISDFAQLNGARTVESDSTLSSGDTVIPLTMDITGALSSGSPGSITNLYDYIDFDGWCKLLPRLNMPGAVFVNPEGLELRVIPADSTKLKRFVGVFTFVLPMDCMDFVSNQGLIFGDLLEDHCIEANRELLFFVEYHGIDAEGTSYVKRRAFKGVLKEVPGWLYGDQGTDSSAADLQLEFTCTGDGVYSNWDSVGSATFRARS